MFGQAGRIGKAVGQLFQQTQKKKKNQNKPTRFRSPANGKVILAWICLTYISACFGLTVRLGLAKRQTTPPFNFGISCIRMSVCVWVQRRDASVAAPKLLVTIFHKRHLKIVACCSCCCCGTYCANMSWSTGVAHPTSAQSSNRTWSARSI